MNKRPPILYLCKTTAENGAEKEINKTPGARVRAQNCQHVLAHALLRYALYHETEQKTRSLCCIQSGREDALGCLILTEERLCRLISSMPLRARLEADLLYTARGKPYLKPAAFGSHSDTEGRRVTFNLSHTDGAVVCALGACAIGVDIERCAGASVRSRDGLLRHCLTEQERSYVYAARTEQEQSVRFLRLWTLKESFAKARALGLSLPFRSLSFPLWELNTAEEETKMKIEQQSTHPAEETKSFPLFSLDGLWRDKRGERPDGWAFWQGVCGCYVISLCARKSA